MALPGNTARSDGDYFCVEASDDANARSAAIERYFPDFESASEFADSMKARYTCVWMSEWGEYVTGTGNVRECWIYFWWTPRTEWGEVFGRGTGYPDDRATPVEYRRIAS